MNLTIAAHRLQRLLSSGHVMIALFVALALAGPLGRTAGAQVQADEGGGLMGGNLAVVAQGVAAFPADPVVWRVVRDSAPLAADASTLERALGFAIADTAPILIADDGSGALSQLGVGEAAFIPEGAAQRHIAGGDAAAPYVRIGLVDQAEAQYTAGGELLTAGAPFANPGGQRDIDLLYGRLAEDEDATVAETGFPTALVVTNGSIDAAVGDQVFSLAAGEATTLAGTLTIIATAEGSTFYAAVIGDEVSVAGGGAQSDDGTVGLDIFTAGCVEPEPGSSLQELADSCTLTPPSSTVVVSTDAGDFSTDTLPITGDSRMMAQLTGLPANSFATILGDDPAGYQFLTMFCGDIATGQFIQPQNSAVQLPGAGGVTCFIYYLAIETDAPVGTGDSAGSGTVDLFEVGCADYQPGRSFQELRATCDSQVPARQVVLGTTAGELVATTAPMGDPLPDMRATFDPVAAGGITVQGAQPEGWVFAAGYCGNPNLGGVELIQNPGHLLEDGEYWACFYFYRPA